MLIIKKTKRTIDYWEFTWCQGSVKRFPCNIMFNFVINHKRGMAPIFIDESWNLPLPDHKVL